MILLVWAVVCGVKHQETLTLPAEGDDVVDDDDVDVAIGITAASMPFLSGLSWRLGDARC